ncbi:POTRA domain-containing protein [Arenibacter sp. F20364]|uniref:POTRA domain-containing protein n=1 Tax=Arenibacter sp. F20364 TaxID=2926415 RepID=UPI001FF50A97|nr:POTRA domain-containing protein [Arenibacter sp. F20364]MCK0192720.1 outer membrane protein assembly factor [Arenibacter sp. F20364]
MRIIIPFAILLLLFSKVTHGQTLVVNVDIQGNNRTRKAFIEKIIRLKTGMKLDSSLIEQDIYRLKRLPSVSHAYFQVSRVKEGEAYHVVYGIEENFTCIPFASVYTTTNDEFAYRVGLQEFNALGNNIILGGFYQKDIFDSYAFHVRAPYLFGKRLGMAWSYQNLTTQEPVFLDAGIADYRYNNESFEVLGLYQFGLRHNLEMGITLFTEDYQYLFGSTAPSVPQSLKVDKYSYKLHYSYDAIRYHYQYLSGFKNAINVQYVLSANEQQLPEFIIGFNDFTFFKRVGRKGNWANRLRLGLASNLKTPFAPFAVDNNLNIRGVGNTVDRGTAAIVFNTEYRHTLLDKDWFVLQSNIFVDGGSWRNPGGDFSDFGDNQNLRIYPGVGIRLIHKHIFNAIFRIDYGHGITIDSSMGIVFGIGQYF